MSPPSRTAGRAGNLIAVLAALAAAASALFVGLDLTRNGFGGTGLDGPTSIAVGWMLASLAAVMLSLIAPDRMGWTALAAGAAGFFASLGYALLNGVRL